MLKIAGGLHKLNGTVLGRIICKPWLFKSYKKADMVKLISLIKKIVWLCVFTSVPSGSHSAELHRKLEYKSRFVLILHFTGLASE